MKPRYNSFITSALRAATRRWGPKSEAKTLARVRRGYYTCAECKEEMPATFKNERGRRTNNSVVDHIVPVVDPAVGFTNWDDYIKRMFCEVEGLQVLCYNCNRTKINEERAIAADRRQSERKD